MSTLRLTEKYITEFARRPLNLVLLVVVPVVFVALAAPAIADFAEIVGGVADAQRLAAPTAGWAAAFLAGVAGFFHVLGSREADRRLAMSGMGPGPIVGARLVSGIALAGGAAATALAALALRTGIDDPLRAIVGAILFALIYLGIGVLVGALTKSEINGSLVIIFVWMVDVFLGPAMSGDGIWVTRLFPSHYVTLVMLDASSGHAGPLGDMGWALSWTVGALLLAAYVFATVVGVRRPAPAAPLKGLRRTAAVLRHGFRDYRRNGAMWVLLLFLPVFFITLSFTVTPDQPTPVEVRDGGATAIRIVSMIDVHGAIMVPITIGFLAGLAGLFVVQGALDADSRLTIAGYRPGNVLVARFGVIALGVTATTLVSIAVTALDFEPARWGPFILGNTAVGVIYALLGVIVGMFAGNLGGMYIMFLVPFIDIGIAQNLMFSAAPPDWGIGLPGRGPVQIIVDGAFSGSGPTAGDLLLTASWIGVLLALALVGFRRIMGPSAR